MIFVLTTNSYLHLLRLVNHYASIATETVRTSPLLSDLATALSVILGLLGEPNDTKVQNPPYNSNKLCYLCCRVEIQISLNGFVDSNTDNETGIHCKHSSTFCFCLCN